MSDVKHFIKMWKFFNEEMSMARYGKSILCGLNQMFCDLVIKKAIDIIAAPTPEAKFETKLEQLCGQTPTGKFFYMCDIQEPFGQHISTAMYHIELALAYNGGLPVHYVLAVDKNDFDNFLNRMMLYVNPDLPIADFITKGGKNED